MRGKFEPTAFPGLRLVFAGVGIQAASLKLTYRRVLSLGRLQRLVLRCGGRLHLWGGHGRSTGPRRGLAPWSPSGPATGEIRVTRLQAKRPTEPNSRSLVFRQNVHEVIPPPLPVSYIFICAPLWVVALRSGFCIKQYLFVGQRGCLTNGDNQERTD